MAESISGYNTIISPSGRKYLDKNIGTDNLSPFGKYYTFDEAKSLCPIGTRLPSWKEVEEDIKWLIKTLPLGASGQGGKVGFIGYYWTGEDENVVEGDALFFSVIAVGDNLYSNINGDYLISNMAKVNRNLVRCVLK